jgi:hypothetical protein
MMPELSLAAAFLAGLLGSTHCVAMCGGIAAALGSTARSRGPWQPLLYQLGRIASYATAGAVVGAAGVAAGFGFEVSRWSAILRLVSAAVIIVIGLDISLGSGARSRWLRAPERWGALLWRGISLAARMRLPASPAMRALALGLLWGWLPCGLVYSVLIVAALAGGAGAGALTMICFGLGTLPVVTGLSYAGTRLPGPQGTAARLAGAALVACGLWSAIAPLASLSGAHQHQHDVIAAATRGPLS